MNTNAWCCTTAVRATAYAVAAAYPFLGLGTPAKSLIDTAATEAMTTVLSDAVAHAPTAVGIAACEGARDDAPLVELPAAAEGHGVRVVCDPIDGTLNAARGGPRAVSALAFTTAPDPPPYLHDSQSIFAIGSHTFDVAAALDTDPFPQLAEHLHHRGQLTATLHRDDNLGLLRDLTGRPLTQVSVGSRAGYRPTLAGPGWLAVGDSSITLPYECDLEFGRIGLVEAQIQSALYPNWCGLIVSRDRIHTHRGGLRGYLHSYLNARGRNDVDQLRTLFTRPELDRFDATNTPITSITATLTRDTFGVGQDAVIALAALASPADPLLPPSQRPPALTHPRWRSNHHILDVDIVLRTGARTDRRTQSVAIDDARVLPEHTRAWYTALSWSSVSGARELADLAEGRTTHSLNAYEDATA